MAYNHGIAVLENPTSVPTPAVNDGEVPVIFGTAPINLASDPRAATNKLFLCNTFAEAQAAVGYSDDYENYTLCQAMDSFFKVFKIAPVIICNVLDPDKHKMDYSEEITVIGERAVSTKKGILLDTLTVSNESTPLVKDTDYTVEFNDKGYVVVTVIKEAVSKVKMTGKAIDPSTVTDIDIIGSYDAGTGKETGIELARRVFPTFGVRVNFLLAPGWSQIPSVGLALSAKEEKLSGLFKCRAVIDIDTKKATKYTDVEKVKKDSGFASEDIVVWPMVSYGGKVMYYSAIYAAMTCLLDYNNGSVPNISPSNEDIKVSAAVIYDGTEVCLDITQANELNAVGVVTALNLNGAYRSWGNNTAAYPGTTDPKDRWICCRRFFDWYSNSFIATYLEKVDDPGNYRLVESIVDSENVRGNSLVSQGKCAGAKIVYSKEDNPVGNIVNGNVVFRQYIAPYTPAEYILDILEFDPTMLEAALGGE